MIGSLRGVILDRLVRGGNTAGEVLLEVGGVGYRVLVSPPTLGQMGELGGPAFLYIHTHVREDAIVLYGFSTREERGCFEALIGTHGVGPAVALAILSVHSPTALRRAVAADDRDALTLVPGIGAKTAARLLIELKTRLDLDGDGETELSLVGAAGNGAPRAAARAEVRAALAGLGYGADEVRLALQSLPETGAVEELLKSALKQLAGAR
jgi:holliday junction DNA helicase RuvA